MSTNIPIESFAYTKEMADKMKTLLEMNDNRISAVFWQANEWWPRISSESKIQWIEQVRENRIRFE